MLVEAVLGLWDVEQLCTFSERIQCSVQQEQEMVQFPYINFNADGSYSCRIVAFWVPAKSSRKETFAVTIGGCGSGGIFRSCGDDKAFYEVCSG